MLLSTDRNMDFSLFSLYEDIFQLNYPLEPDKHGKLVAVLATSRAFLAYKKSCFIYAVQHFQILMTLSQDFFENQLHDSFIIHHVITEIDTYNAT